MLFVNAVLAGSFAVLAAAQSSVLGFTRVPNPITAGQPQAITYMTNDTVSPVTITLRQGDSGNLQTIQTLTTSASGGQYIWTPAKTLPNDSDYALEITQGSQVNYFGPFSIQGGGEASSSSSSASSSSASSTLTTSAATLSTGLAGINATLTSFGSTGIPLSTGISTHSNATITSAHNSTTLATTSVTPTPTTTDGAGFQTTSSPTPTGNSAAAMGSSAIALVFGAVAAIAFC